MVKGDIIGCNNIVGSSQNEYDTYSNSVNIRELNNTIRNQEYKIEKLESVINFLCEKFSISLKNLDSEHKKLQERTEVEKRLDSI